MYLHNLVHPVSFFSSLSSSYLPYLSPINKKRAEGKETAFVLETGHHPGMGWTMMLHSPEGNRRTLKTDGNMWDLAYKGDRN
jgi:hypothetical protein